MQMRDIEGFLLEARAQSYTAGGDTSVAKLPGSVQYDYARGDYSYIDTYYLGNGKFPGLETVFYKGKPMWSMSYFGNYSDLSEDEIDRMLRKALTDFRQTTRTYHHVTKDYDDFTYICAGEGSMEEVSGTEEIQVGNETVYYFYYAGGFIG